MQELQECLDWTDQVSDRVHSALCVPRNSISRDSIFRTALRQQVCPEKILMQYWMRWVIEACHAVDNPASGAVMRKLGLSFVRDSQYAKQDGSEIFSAKTYRWEENR